MKETLHKLLVFKPPAVKNLNALTLDLSAKNLHLKKVVMGKIVVLLVLVQVFFHQLSLHHHHLQLNNQLMLVQVGLGAHLSSL